MIGRAEFWLWPVSIVGALALHGGLATLFAGTVAEAAVPPPEPLHVTISAVPTVNQVIEPVTVATAVAPPIAAVATAVAVQAAPAVATEVAAAAVAAPVQAAAPVAPQVAAPVQTVAAQEVATLAAAPVAPMVAVPAVPAPLATTAVAASEASAVPTGATAAPVAAAPALVAISETLLAASPGSDPGLVAIPPVATVAAAEPIAVAAAAEAIATAMMVAPTAVSVAAAAGIPLASASPGIGTVAAAPGSSVDTAGTVAPVAVANAAPTVAAPAGIAAVAVAPSSNVATAAGTVAPVATAAPVMAASGAPVVPAATITAVTSPTIATAPAAGVAPQVIAGEEDVQVANIPDAPVVEAPAVPPVPNEETLSAFLGGYEGGSCFAARIDTVNGSATLAAYAVDFADSVALQLALGESFDAPVDVAGYRAEPSQCGALAFVSRIQHRAGGWLALSLAAERLTDGETLTGTVVGSTGATIHLFIVDDEGTVSDVGPYVETKGTTASFAVPVHLTGDAAATKLQLVIAVATGSALVPPVDGQAAEPFFAELTQRLAETGGPAGIAIAAFALE